MAESDSRLVGGLRKRLAEAGLSGSFLVRDLIGGREIGIDPEVIFPVASLVKVPLAVAVLDRTSAGKLDGAMAVEVPPSPPTSGFEAGLSQFRHPARIAVDDLLYLSVAISDNPAAEALFDLVPPAEVTDVLRGYGIAGIAVRHQMRDPVAAPTDVRLAQTLAIGAREAGLGHGLPQIDVTRANTGSARAFVDLLQALWMPSAVPREVAGGVRTLMRANIMRQDSARTSSPTRPPGRRRPARCSTSATRWASSSTRTAPFSPSPRSPSPRSPLPRSPPPKP